MEILRHAQDDKTKRTAVMDSPIHIVRACCAGCAARSIGCGCPFGCGIWNGLEARSIIFQTGLSRGQRKETTPAILCPRANALKLIRLPPAG